MFELPCVHTIDAESSVYEAIGLMAEHNVGALVVTSGSSPMAGIISERDYARKVILKDRSSRDTRVSEVMSSPVIHVREDTPLDHCMSLLVQKKIRHLPVVAGYTPVAMITPGDVMQSMIRELTLTIEQLESFMYAEEGGEG